MFDADTFDLTELCERADVTPRTVRYYIQQGLLPSPGARGPGVRYDRGHLDRLRLIRRLQREHLPLAEIRRRLSELDDDVVRQLAESPEERGPAAATSALDYVRDLLAGRGRGESGAATTEQPSFLSRRPEPGPPSSAIPHIPPSALRAAADNTRVAMPQPPAQRQAERAQWERITLHPDVELHIRRPLSREQIKLVERLLDAARALFHKEEP